VWITGNKLWIKPDFGGEIHPSNPFYCGEFDLFLESNGDRSASNLAFFGIIERSNCAAQIIHTGFRTDFLTGTE
jgi:hypothetical protein